MMIIRGSLGRYTPQLSYLKRYYFVEILTK